LEQKGGFGLKIDTNESLSRLISAFISGIGTMKSKI